MPQPRVSVVMPVWNGARFLDEAISSIASQTLRDLELLVVDDGSTDGSSEIALRWKQRDARIAVLSTGVNSGASAAANLGIEAARGIYVARQDADDLSLPDRLRLQAERLDRSPEAVAVSMAFQFIDERGVVLRTERHLLAPELIELLTLFTNPLGGASQVMFRREHLLAAGGYDTSLTQGEDAELYARLVRRGPIVTMPEIGMRYRLHGDQATGRDSAESADRRALTVTRPLLQGFLGRPLGEREVLAVAGAWRGWNRHLDIGAVDAVMREVAGRFRQRHPGRGDLHRRFESIVASRLAVTALLLARAGSLGEAAACFRSALRRDAAAALAAPPRLVSRSVAMAVRKRLGRQG